MWFRICHTMKRKAQLKVMPNYPAVLVLLVMYSATVTGENGTEKGEIEELQEYIVGGVAQEVSINPLAHPVDSVYGWQRDLLSIPRGVSLISPELMEDRYIDSVAEIIPFSPSTHAPSSYGNNTTPHIRGDVAEFYVNGQRRSGNEFGFDPSFNSVESINVVRGPGTVSFGPGFYSGGYVNYITKRPDLEDRSTKVTIGIGTWVPGHDSYVNSFLRIDRSVPLSKGKLGLRVSYEGKENDTFFHRNGGREDYQDLFLALRWRPNRRLDVYFAGQYIWQGIPELLGVNRPYNGLIRGNLYLNGQLTEPLEVTPGGFSFRAQVSGTTDFDPQDTLLSTADYSNANVASAQTISRLSLGGGSTLVNRTFVEHVNRRRHHDFSYTEYVRQLTFETRNEWEKAFNRGEIDHELLAGFGVRYADTEAYMNYFHYYPYAFDITVGPPFRAENTIGLFGQPGPGGRLFYGSQEGIPETTHSKVWHPAVFWQHEISFNDRFQVLYGLRGNAYNADVSDPLPPQGADSAWSDDGAFYSGDYNVSLTYKAEKNLSIYATFNRTHAMDGSSGGGAIMLTGDGLIEAEDFRNRSELVEGGVRASLLENSLYVAATGFRQDRFRSELGGGKSGIRVSGFEFEGVYQPVERFYLLTNLTYMSGHYNDASPFVLGGADLNGLFTTNIARQADPNSIGADGQVVAGDHTISGLSQWTVNFGTSWRSQRGFGFRLWGSVRSPQNGNLLGQYTIPRQFELNGSLFLRNQKWEASLSFLNFTDERNWSHNGDEFGSNVFISRDLPSRMEAHFRIFL